MDGLLPQTPKQGNLSYGLTLPSLYHLSLLFDATEGDDDDDTIWATLAAVTSPPPFVRSRHVRFSELAFSTCSELSPRICVSGTVVGKRRGVRVY